MRYLKLFESFNKEDIDSICRKFGIENYTTNEDGSIDVDGGVNLSYLIGYEGLTELPLKFRNVTGSFYCDNNKLTSLEGSPQSVGGNFECSYNKLTTLEGSHQSVGGNFYCYKNQLISLDGCPQLVGDSFHCDNNQLKTLEGCPKSIGRDFTSYVNPCSSIYQDWINDGRRGDLMDMMKDYDFLRGNTINWYLLEAFFNDAGFPVPNRKELEKYYTIED
jgi:hypothetical protein